MSLHKDAASLTENEKCQYCKNTLINSSNSATTVAFNKSRLQVGKALGL